MIHVFECSTHDACTVIALEAADGQPGFDLNGTSVVWASHAHEDLHVECRCEPAIHPTITDHRGDEPIAVAASAGACSDCIDHPRWPR